MNLLESEVPPDVLRDIIDRASARRVFYAWRFEASNRLCDRCVANRSTSRAHVANAHDYSLYPIEIQMLFSGRIVEVEY